MTRATTDLFCSCVDVNPQSPLVIAEQRKAYIRYSMFAWGFPFVIVGICVALQFANVGNVGYGEILYTVYYFAKFTNI